MHRADRGKDGKCDLSEGFWREFFLLKPDKSCLQELLGALSSAELLARQVGSVAGRACERERGEVLTVLPRIPHNSSLRTP